MKRKSVLAALLCFLVFLTVTPVLADEVPAAAVSMPIYACTRITSLPYTISNRDSIMWPATFLRTPVA